MGNGEVTVGSLRARGPAPGAAAACVGCGLNTEGKRWYVQLPVTIAGTPPREYGAIIFHGRWCDLRRRPELNATPYPKGFSTYSEAREYACRRLGDATRIRIVCV